MAKKNNDAIWKEDLEKFSSYKGTVINYCRENNISKGQFYYYKKKLNGFIMR
ncbi:MAG: hypothetical protein N4A64_15655 [Marinisporobacter sp.]|jgi:hypothetical protein|nr:hypothetical protein [Marinisporobacter sp.]